MMRIVIHPLCVLKIGEFRYIIDDQDVPRTDVAMEDIHLLRGIGVSYASKHVRKMKRDGNMNRTHALDAVTQDSYEMLPILECTDRQADLLDDHSVMAEESHRILSSVDERIGRLDWSFGDGIG